MAVSVPRLLLTVPWVLSAVCDCGISWSYSLEFGRRLNSKGGGDNHLMHAAVLGV